MYIATPVVELKGHCAGYAEKEDRYSDEKVHTWTCRTVETMTGRSYRLSERLYENAEQVGS